MCDEHRGTPSGVLATGPSRETVTASQSSLHTRLQRRGEAVDLGLRPLLRDGHRDAVCQLWVPPAQRQPGVVARGAELRQEGLRVTGHLQRELLHERRLEAK